MYEVPEGWTTCTLGDIAYNVKAKWLPQSLERYRYVGLEHIGQGTGKLVGVGNSLRVTSTKTQFSATDVLFGKLRPNLRKTAFPKFEGVCSTDILAIRPKKAIDGEYLHYLLAADTTITHAVDTAAGTKMPRTSWKLLADLAVGCPPLLEQKKIAEVLTSVDETIAATKAVIEQSKQIKKGLLQTLLTKGIGHTQFKPSPLGDIPESWEVVELESIASVERGKFSIRPRNDPRYFGGDIPFVQTGDIVAANGFLRRHKQTLNTEGLKVSKQFPIDSILITIAANIGDTAITTYPICCPDSVVAVQPKVGFNVCWLQHVLSSKKTHLESVATQNAQKNINLTHLKPLLIAVPPQDEREQIAMSLNSLRNSIEANKEKLVQLQTLKSGLMSDLLTGRVRV